nr:hypothetical protein [Tanacetum cinerariifolium]
YLPSNTIANPRSDLKAITTRSGVSYDGPQILPPPSFLPPVVENEPEATKDTVNPTNNGNTEDVQPHAVHPKPVTSPISEPTITPYMQTRSSSRLVSNPSSNPTPSTNPNPKGHNHRRSKQRIKEFNLDELSPPIVTMADQRTMAQLLQAPIEGYEDAIVVPTITADNFELKHGLLTLVQNKQFFGHDKEGLHAHIRYFNKITSTLKFPNVPNTFKDLLQACPHHGFSELHQLDTFYNALNLKDQDSLNSAAGGNFLDKMPRECLAIIERNSKVRCSRNKPVVAKVSMNTSTSGISPDVAELKDMVKALILDKKSQKQAPATMKAVEESSYQAPAPQTQGVSKDDFLAYVKVNDAVMRNMQIQLTNLTELLTKFVNSNNASTSSSGTLSSNTVANPRSDLKAITTQSGVSYDGPQMTPPPSFLPKVMENKPEATKDTVTPPNNGSTEDVQPSVVQTETPVIQISKPVASPVSAPNPNPKSSIPFADALILIPKFASTLKALIENKEKLSEMARTPSNEHCSVVHLKKLPKKLGDPCKFLIPCDFPGMDECLALVDLGASINLMPMSMWKRLSLPKLTPNCMTLELMDRSISRPIGVAEDVYVKVRMFHFPAGFVVVAFDVDPRVPLILGRSFLKTGRALIDVFEVKLTLCVGKEAITFNLDQTSRYSANYNDNSINRIDVIEMACEEYPQEVLGFFDVITSGNPTYYYDPIVSTSSLTLTPFENIDFLLEEVDAFLAIEDDPTSPKAKSDKSSIDEPSEVELKDLPPHLKYTFLEGDDKLPVIIAKDLSMKEKTALITDDFKPAVQHQRSVNPKIYDVIKQEVLKLLDAGLIYPISDNPWISPVQCVPKKGGFTIVENEANELILTRLVTGWHMYIDYCHFGFYRRFIKDFSKIAQPMTRLLKKDTLFIFSKECVEAFQTLKRKLTEAPILIAPDWDMPYDLMCDASDFAIGNVSCGVYFENIWSYLIMNKSIVYTDHSALKYLFAKKDSKLRLLRWVLLLQEFTFKVIDTKGAENLAADHLSRLENPYQNVLDPKEINESFPLETLNLVLTRGDQRKVQLNELRDLAYENSLIYKEKTKRLHDSKTKDCVFNIGDRVLFFNLRLKIFSGKLKSRRSGPFTISHVYPYRTVQFYQPDGPNFKVNGHKLKHYFGEDCAVMWKPAFLLLCVVWFFMSKYSWILKTHAKGFCPPVFISSASFGNHVNDRLKATRDRQKSYAYRRRKPLEFSVGDYVLLKVLPWKDVVHFGKKGKLAHRFVGPFKIIEKVGPVAYRLYLHEELNGVHDTFHVSNLQKCLANPTLQVPLDEIQVDAKFNFVEEPVEILERGIKKLKRSIIPIVKVWWNSKHGPEFTWERKDQMKLKYQHLFSADK